MEQNAKNNQNPYQNLDQSSSDDKSKEDSNKINANSHSQAKPVSQLSSSDQDNHPQTTSKNTDNKAIPNNYIQTRNPDLFNQDSNQSSQTTKPVVDIKVDTTEQIQSKISPTKNKIMEAKFDQQMNPQQIHVSGYKMSRSKNKVQQNVLSAERDSKDSDHAEKRAELKRLRNQFQVQKEELDELRRLEQLKLEEDNRKKRGTGGSKRRSKSTQNMTKKKRAQSSQVGQSTVQKPQNQTNEQNATPDVQVQTQQNPEDVKNSPDAQQAKKAKLYNLSGNANPRRYRASNQSQNHKRLYREGDQKKWTNTFSRKTIHWSEKNDCLQQEAQLVDKALVDVTYPNKVPMTGEINCCGNSPIRNSHCGPKKQHENSMKALLSQQKALAQDISDFQSVEKQASKPRFERDLYNMDQVDNQPVNIESNDHTTQKQRDVSSGNKPRVYNYTSINSSSGMLPMTKKQLSQNKQIKHLAKNIAKLVNSSNSKLHLSQKQVVYNNQKMSLAQFLDNCSKAQHTKSS